MGWAPSNHVKCIPFDSPLTFRFTLPTKAWGRKDWARVGHLRTLGWDIYALEPVYARGGMRKPMAISDLDIYRDILGELHNLDIVKNSKGHPSDP